jgi:hypothetical protein
VFGTQQFTEDGHPMPIGEPRSWQISYFPAAPWFWYFAWSGRVKNGRYRHFRIGARWDNVDDYVQFPAIATRTFTTEAIQDTSTC